ncbi:MAG: DUF445 domain-containing protein [Anaerovibrio sp.]|nr:DUF445 domain-containing protein [Selenomonadaceae bacterium]MDD6397901.1 DUF445 domain-containing protein [Selenomonadaceae bacterium]MDY6053251.1 DUF445 domain-containing protein [Anaerovibrio sp.]
MAMGKKHKANIALAISILGAGATFSVANAGFLGGMLHNGFLAASIGGLADWFAITALFKKPLGISYRTEIIIRNRQRIMDAITDFISDDLLSSDNVMQFVNRQDTSRFVAGVIEKQGERKLLPVIRELARQLAQSIEPVIKQQGVKPAAEALLQSLDYTACGRALCQSLAAADNIPLISNILLAAGRELMGSESAQAILEKNIGEMLETYAGEDGSRSFFVNLLKMFNLDEEKMASNLVAFADKWLIEAQDDVSKQQLLDNWLADNLPKLAENSAFHEKAGKALAVFLQREEIMTELQGYIQQKFSREKLEDMLVNASEGVMQKYLADEIWQANADRFIKKKLQQLLESKHDSITDMIETKLSSLSDEDLVSFTQEKVADDLQMIRINGSVVGGIAGMLLYGLIAIAGQVIR